MASSKGGMTLVSEPQTDFATSDMPTEAGADTIITRFADLARTAEALMQWDGLPE